MKKIIFNVEANEDLFNRWKGLGDPFEIMKSIVQNDTKITPQQLEEWISNYVGARDRFAKKLDKLFSETAAYVRSCINE